MNIETHCSRNGGNSVDVGVYEEETVALNRQNYVDPSAAKLFSLLPCVAKIPIFGEACAAFGATRVASLSVGYFLCKGIADSIISYATLPLFTERYGVDGQRYQRLSSIVTMGWSIKAFTAMLCDGFACGGYTKRWYMFASAVLGSVFALILGFLPANESSANTACAFLFLTSYGKANMDILSEGFYSRLMRRQPKAGPALVSWIWWSIMVGCIIAAAIQGPLADSSMVQIGIFISAALQALCVPIFFFNLYGEKRNSVERWEDALAMEAEVQKALQLRESLQAQATSENAAKDLNDTSSTSRYPASLDSRVRSDAIMPYGISDDELPGTLDDETYNPSDVANNARQHMAEPVSCLFGLFEINKEVIYRNWRIFIYSIVMTCAVVTLACGTILADTLGLLIICIVVSVVCCGCSLWALPLVIAKANIFGYLQMVCYIQLPGALNSFYVADSDCLPDGPHFSYTFYYTISAVIGNIGGLVGVSVFNYIFAKRSYRLTVILTTIIQIIASVFDIIIVKRWNIRIGIPDHAMYICGDAVVYQVCYYLAWMPVVILISRLCPRGSESMVYALMAGFANLGQTLSSSVGAVIMEYALHVATQVPCDFSNVPLLVLIGHLLVPLLIIPLSWLLPSARICDDIDVDGNAVLDEVKKCAQQEAKEEATAVAGGNNPDASSTPRS